MQIKSVVSAAAIVLAFSVGSASAAERFSTLDGVSAQPMNAAEMTAVQGTAVIISAIANRPASVVHDGNLTLLILSGTSQAEQFGRREVDLLTSTFTILVAEASRFIE